LPGDGHLTVRLPVVVSEAAALGNAQVSASYDLLREAELVPHVSLTTQVDLPTARGATSTRPALKATAAKSLGPGLLEGIHLESELSTDTALLLPSYRTSLGASFRLPAQTRVSLDFVALRPAPQSGVARRNFAQLGVSRTLGKRTHVRLGVGSDTKTVHASLGVDRPF
jgi:hypothetical protein